MLITMQTHGINDFKLIRNGLLGQICCQDLMTVLCKTFLEATSMVRPNRFYQGFKQSPLLESIPVATHMDYCP